MNTAPCCLAISLLAPFGVSAQLPVRDLSIDVIEGLGREIYRRDMAAAKATDIMFDQRLNLDDYPLRGWIVTEDSAGLLVAFVGEYDGEYKAVFDVRPDQTGRSQFTISAGRALSTEEVVQFNARAVSQNEIAEPCSERYNSVVLKDPERDGWIVYWLAATTQPGTMVLGGHYRVMVSADGQKVVAADRLSRSCVAIEQTPPSSDQETAAAVVSHLVSPTPVETHVFASLLHGKPIYVLTENETIWAVEGDSIRKVDQSELE
jgi:hypothetical protein